MKASVTADRPPQPLLSPKLLERVLAKLGLSQRPSLDLSGLNTVYAAFCRNISFDNVQKRIWFAGPRRGPLPIGDPDDFFEKWLRHGTGGTCWPINGALCGLLRTLGFPARRIAGSVIVEGYPQGANHGSVLVALEGTDYLSDACMASMQALPLRPHHSAFSGAGIHQLKALPAGNGHEILWMVGWIRERPLVFRPEPEHDPVDHAFFLQRYGRTKNIGFFNDALLVSRAVSDCIITVGRGKVIRVAQDGTVTRTQIDQTEQAAVLINEFGLSEEIVQAIPDDLVGAAAPPGL